MREPPNWFLRITVPLLLVGAGVFLLFAVFRNTTNVSGSAGQPASTSAVVEKAPEGAAPAESAAAPSDAPPATPPPEPAPPPTPATDPVAAEGTPPSEVAPPTPAVPAATPTTPTPAAGVKYIVRKHPARPYSKLGSTLPSKDGGTYEMELEFAAFGAGVSRLTLTNHAEKILSPEPKVLQQFLGVFGTRDPRLGLAAFSGKGVTINGVQVGLGVPNPVDPQSVLWRELGPGEFEAVIADGEGNDVLRITRKYTLGPGAFEFTIEQRLANLSTVPLNVEWRQIGPIDQPPETVRYGGDPRAVRFGYMLPTARDPAQIVQSDDGTASLITHNDAIGSPEASGVYAPRTFWPSRASEKDSMTLAWAATTSRYFTVAVTPYIAADATALTATTPAQRTLPVVSVERVAVPTDRPSTVPASKSGPFGAVGLELVWPVVTVAPGTSADLSIGAYAGPTSKRQIAREKRSTLSGLASVVIYTFGGPCAFCTFQTITALLAQFMSLLHDYVLFDWALAIIVLVVCVRTILHPVTRWSQVKMLRSGKIMGKLAPKQKAIQEKYANDPDGMRREVGRLMQEEGMGAGAGMVMGCVPAFLQMPVWMALSATLYFLFELRHQGAFFGVFQEISGGSWAFFADLAEPDHFLAFGREFHIPLLSGLMGPIDGLNVMPLLMGAVFYVQQKYMAPPPTTAMTPEQEQQMKIMRVMTVVLFPLFMYNAPSGLALYFFANSSLGILESRWIRKKAEPIITAELEAKEQRKAAGVGTSMWDRKDKAGEKPGFFARMQKLAEERQRMMDEARKLQARQATQGKKGKKK